MTALQFHNRAFERCGAAPHTLKRKEADSRNKTNL
jgi:hypothetical protein